MTFTQTPDSIRQELEERISQIQAERQKKQMELAELESIEHGLHTVLNSENALWERMTPTAAPLFTAEGQKNGNKTLSDALLDLLARGPLTVDQFKPELEKRGYHFGDKAPGRVINFSLVGLQNRGLVRKREGGDWQLNQAKN